MPVTPICNSRLTRNRESQPSFSAHEFSAHEVVREHASIPRSRICTAHLTKPLNKVANKTLRFQVLWIIQRDVKQIPFLLSISDKTKVRSTQVKAKRLLAPFSPLPVRWHQRIKPKIGEEISRRCLAGSASDQRLEGWTIHFERADLVSLGD